MLLKNKIAVITGGGRGIGRAIALAFAREGADVALIARTNGEIQRSAAEIQALGRQCIALSADITDENQIAQAFGCIFDRFGRVDVLVNNAGVEYRGLFSEISMDQWDRTLSINLRGTVLCTRLVLPDMIKRNDGQIINIGSGSGLRGSPGSAAYGASKAAVVALTHALAEEVRENGIRVNVICPGPIDTAMLAPETRKAKRAQLLQPEEVAGTAVFIASSLSGKITGQVFSVRNSNRW